MQLILATRNPSKQTQIREVFYNFPASILDLAQAQIQGEAVEDGNSLEENALKKAQHAFDQLLTKTYVMAEDTGFFINALNGAPGIHAARWAGDDVPTEYITEYTLDKLKGVEDRSAYFRAVVALIDPNGRVIYFDGTVDGTILESPKTAPQPKMPYSSIFVPTSYNKVWAEMTTEEENGISHRGKAFRKVRSYLENE